jgi:hypothetical protein
MTKQINFFEQLKQDASITFSNKPKVVYVRRQVSVGDVRKKVVENLTTNKAVFEGKSNEEVLANYKLVGNTYQFTIKYGVRPLPNVLGGSTYVDGLNHAQMLSAFDTACAMVERGDCDTALQTLMAANTAMRKKVKAKPASQKKKKVAA